MRNRIITGNVLDAATWSAIPDDSPLFPNL